MSQLEENLNSLVLKVYSPRTKGFIAALLRKSSIRGIDVHDVQQEVILRLARKGNNDGSVIVTIKNYIREKVREAQRERRYVDRVVSAGRRTTPEGDPPISIKDMLRKQSNLTDLQREIFLLRLDGHKAREISKILGKSHGVVQWQMRLARAALGGLPSLSRKKSRRAR